MNSATPSAVRTKPSARNASSPQEKETAPLGKKLSACCRAARRARLSIADLPDAAGLDERCETDQIVGLGAVHGDAQHGTGKGDPPVHVAAAIAELDRGGDVGGSNREPGRFSGPHHD